MSNLPPGRARRAASATSITMAWIYPYSPQSAAPRSLLNRGGKENHWLAITLRRHPQQPRTVRRPRTSQRLRSDSQTSGCRYGLRIAPSDLHFRLGSAEKPRSRLCGHPPKSKSSMTSRPNQFLEVRERSDQGILGSCSHGSRGGTRGSGGHRPQHLQAGLNARTQAQQAIEITSFRKATETRPAIFSRRRILQSAHSATWKNRDYGASIALSSALGVEPETCRPAHQSWATPYSPKAIATEAIRPPRKVGARRTGNSTIENGHLSTRSSIYNASSPSVPTIPDLLYYLGTPAVSFEKRHAAFIHSSDPREPTKL